MNTEYNKLIKANSTYQDAVGSMEAALSDKVLFDFGIENIPGDGFCICDVEQENLAPLSACLAFIKKNGQLSQDNHESMSF